MTLTITSIGLIAVITFTAWHFAAFVSKIKQNVLTFYTGLFDVVHLLIMTYLLVSGSWLFLGILLGLTFVKTLTGCLMYATPFPEAYISKKHEIIENFWTRTLVDALLGLICYCTIIIGGVQ